MFHVCLLNDDRFIFLILYSSYIYNTFIRTFLCSIFFFQAEDGIRDLVRSRGLGDVYKRQSWNLPWVGRFLAAAVLVSWWGIPMFKLMRELWQTCLLYTSDAADERSSVDLGGRRIIKKKTKHDRAWGKKTIIKYRRLRQQRSSTYKKRRKGSG